MHKYFIKTPGIVKTLFPTFVWSMPDEDKSVYLTFDDGPHPVVTPFVLDLLKQYNAAASFFCIGKNVINHPDVYKRIIEEGHTVGNHSHNHQNGWKTPVKQYLADVATAAIYIDSNLYRPPYGRIRLKQAAGIKQAMNKTSARIIMWDVLSADFDTSISTTVCVNNVLSNIEPGSIVVFHDSEKAFRILKEALPVIMEKLKEMGYKMKRIEQELS